MPRFNTSLILAITLFIMLAIIGCQKADNTASDRKNTDKIQVFVSIIPQLSIVKNIGGDHVAVESLVKANSSPHDYEPSPRQLARLTEAQVFFSVNMPFEAQMVSKIQMQNSSLHVFSMVENVNFRHFADNEHDEHDGHDGRHDHHESTIDPHVWLGVKQLETMANNTARKLSELYPQYATEFNANLKKYLVALGDVETSLHTALDQYRGGSFYVFHPAFGYFADSFGLKQVAVELEGKSPSAKQISSVITQAKHDNVKIIFVQKQFDAKAAQAIAQAIDGTVVAIDPLAEDILPNLEHIGSEVLKSLSSNQTK